MHELLNNPALYLGFASLHLLLGHFGSAVLYRLRFGGTPLVLYKPAQKTRHQKITQRVALATLVWVASLLAFTFSETFRTTALGAPIVHTPALAGWIPGLLGLTGMLASQANMGRSFRVGQDESSHSPLLVTTGLHRWSRNPVYVFSFLYLVGISLWAPCLSVLLGCAALGTGMHHLVLAEEAFLLQQHGKPYEDYCKRVRRYL